MMIDDPSKESTNVKFKASYIQNTDAVRPPHSTNYVLLFSVDNFTYSTYRTIRSTST